VVFPCSLFPLLPALFRLLLPADCSLVLLPAACSLSLILAPFSLQPAPCTLHPAQCFVLPALFFLPPFPCSLLPLLPAPCSLLPAQSRGASDGGGGQLKARRGAWVGGGQGLEAGAWGAVVEGGARLPGRLVARRRRQRHGALCSEFCAAALTAVWPAPHGNARLQVRTPAAHGCTALAGRCMQQVLGWRPTPSRPGTPAEPLAAGVEADRDSEPESNSPLSLDRRRRRRRRCRCGSNHCT
jgi:hypothetical protein